MKYPANTKNQIYRVHGVLRRKLHGTQLLIVICSLLIVTACAMSRPLEELLSPPKLTDEQAKIYTALQNSKGSSVSLKYPKSGEYRSAFVLYDFDSDGQNEAIVFYETAPQTIWFSILDKRGENWECTSDMSVFGTSVEKVVFANLSDKNEDIIISYTIPGQTETGVEVIHYNKGKQASKLLSGTFSYFDTVNFDGNGGSNALFVIKQDKGLSYANAYAWKNGVFSRVGYTALNPAAIKYLNVTGGYLFPEHRTYALFIDYSKNDQSQSGIAAQGISTGTDVLYMWDGRLINGIYVPPAYSDEDMSETEIPVPAEDMSVPLEKRVNNYTADVSSADIDGDGITELAGTATFPGYEKITADKMRALVWYSLDGDPLSPELTKKYYTYYSVNKDYVFFFPQRWEGQVTVRMDAGDVVFNESSGSIDNPGTEVLRIRAAEKGTPASSVRGFDLYDGKTNAIFDYYVRCAEQELPMGLTADELKDCLKII